MKLRVSKNVVAEYDSDLNDEIDWYDFKYELGHQLKFKFPDRYIRIQSSVTSPISHVTSVRNVCMKLGLAKDAPEYAYNLLSVLFNDIGHLRVYSVQNRPGLVIRHTHHDNPVNGDEYVITSCAESTYDRWMKKYG